jgi:hypothetical protein
MSRMNAICAVLVLAAMVAVVPSAKATGPTGLVVASGSSAMWQTIGLAAFNNGNCGAAKVKLTPPCYHWTSKTKLNLQDTRPTLVKASRGGPGAATEDAGNTWIVWDSNTSSSGPHYWAYIQEDSTVGNRCFFAVPQCSIVAPSGDTFAAGNEISTALWGPDTALPSSLQAILTSTAGAKVNAAASDIRSEDALFAECRANSKLGNGTINGGADDGLDGLGYGVNPSGTCPVYKQTIKGKTVYSTLAEDEGSPIVTGYPGSSSSFNVMAFNFGSGYDPFSGKAVLTTAKIVTISVGIDPIVFVTNRQAALANVLNATAAQLQTVFSGTDCNANNFAGGKNAAIYAYLREPLSGTYNTTESNVMRRPVETLVAPAILGVSQELYTNAPSNNPLKNQPCNSGTGFRSRAIGTGQEVQSVQESQTNNSLDGIGYTFFSFGNVSPIQNSANYAYLTLESVDPIFSAPCGAGPCSAPGQPVNQELPGSATVCGGGGFPCTESQIWGSGNLSFPNVRSGVYSAWSMLRWITTTTNETNVEDLINGSHEYVVSDTPDYIPALAQPAGCSISAGTCVDPGVQIFHSHYQQLDGDGNDLGPAESNGTFNSNGNPVSGDTGGDMGGCIFTTPQSASYDNGFIQIGFDGGGSAGNACSSAAVRP